jgi:hypothetical protein
LITVQVLVMQFYQYFEPATLYIYQRCRPKLAPVFVLLYSLFISHLHTSAQCVGTIENGATDICLTAGSAKTFSNSTASGGVIDWISSGDGTFNNNTLRNPTYTPGPRDIQNGFVYIYLDVYKDDPVAPCSVLPVTTLHLSSFRATVSPAAQTVCSGSTITTINLGSATTGTTYNWTRNNTTAVTGIAASGTGNISGTLTNTGTAPVTVTFTITAISGGCAGTAVTATILVNPRPSAVRTPSSQTICSGASITPITLTSNLTGTTYSWTRNNTTTVTGIAASGTGNISGTLTNTTTAPVTVTFTITPTTNGCTGTPVTAPVLVNTGGNVVATPATQTICSGASITTIASSGGVTGTTYNWTRDNTTGVTGIAASGSGNISGALTNTTTAPVTVTFIITPNPSTCSGSSITARVIVNPRPTVVRTPTSQTTCSGAAITTIALTSSTTGTTYSWTRNNTTTVTGIAASGTGNISGALTNATTAPVTVTFTITPTANGCAGTPITATVLVNPRPSAVRTPSSQTICSGAPITSITLSSNITGTTYSWTRNNTTTATGIAANGTGNISGALTNTTAAAVTVTFTITPTVNGCAGTPVTATVVVNASGNVLATPATQTICSGASITTIAFSGGVTGTTYNWTRDNTTAVTGIAASGSGNISGALINTTTAPVTVTFTITPSPATCSGASITARVIVNPRPTVVRTPTAQTTCYGAAITTIALTSSTTGTTYSWTRNNTTTVTGIAASGTGNIAGALTNTTTAPVTVTFTITPTANGCAGTPVTATVLVNPRPNVITAPSSQTICSGATITTIALSGGVTGTSYSWTRDNSVAVTGIAASGTGNISGTLTNTTTAPVTVTFTITPTANGCAGTPITATVLVNPSGSIVATPVSQTICSGGAISTIVPGGGATGTTYNWTRDNTTSATGIAASGTGNISGALTNTTTSPVTVTFTITPSPAGCSGAATTARVIVNPRPNAIATSASQTICSGATINTIALSGGVTGTTYSWTRDNSVAVTGIAASGTGNISGALTNTTTAPVTVTFTITPTANGCTGTPVSATVIVTPRPNAIATPASQTICSGATITSIALSGGVTGTTHSWTRDNSVAVTGIAASGTGNISGAFTNTTTAPVTVTFTITPTANGCTGTPVTATVIVTPRPNAVATPASQTICSGATITSIALSGGVTGTTYSWTRDNSVAVTGIAASGTGNISGALTNTTTAPVTVTFTITPTANGCTGTPVTATVIVTPRPNAIATPASQTICSGATITTIALSGGVTGTTYSWTRDNSVAVTGIAANGTGNISGAFTNTTTAPVTVTFTITPTANGCIGTPVTATVIVTPRPNAVATPASQTICSGATITSIALSGGVTGTTYSWTRDNSVAVTGIAANGTGNISGALTNATFAPVTVTFTITPTANGCTGTPITATVIVTPRPNAIATSCISDHLFRRHHHHDRIEWRRDWDLPIAGRATIVSP